MPHYVKSEYHPGYFEFLINVWIQI